jgi:hypothetical protein
MGRRQQGEGSLYHRKGRGQWVAVADLGYKGQQRDRREFTGPTPEIALERRARFRQPPGGFTLPKGLPPTVSEWVAHWCWNIAKPKVDLNTWYRSYRRVRTHRPVLHQDQARGAVRGGCGGVAPVA